MLRKMVEGTDYFAEQGRTARLIAAWALAPFALFFTIGALILPVGVVCIAFTGDLQLAGIVLASGLFYALFAIALCWLTVRLFRGRKSANGVTILPTWLVRTFLLAFLGPLTIGMIGMAFKETMAGRVTTGLLLAVMACGFTVSLIRALFVAFRLGKRGRIASTEECPAPGGPC